MIYDLTIYYLLFIDYFIIYERKGSKIIPNSRRIGLPFMLILTDFFNLRHFPLDEREEMLLAVCNSQQEFVKIGFDDGELTLGQLTMAVTADDAPPHAVGNAETAPHLAGSLG